jgi:dihydrofolate reductase
MPIISLIAAIDEQGGLGKNNELLCYLPADLQHFKALTMGKPVIMGRRTFESIGRPLPHRRNIVLSRLLHSISGVEVVSTLKEALALIGSEPEAMVIGGAEIYQQFLIFAHQIYITTIHHTFNADIYFPAIDWSAWRLVTAIDRPKDEKNTYDLKFLHYQKK